MSTAQRKRRLNAIRKAQEAIEGELLFAKKTEPTLSNDHAFSRLYYLIRLARKATK